MSIADEDIRLANQRLMAAHSVALAAQEKVNEFATQALKLELGQVFEEYPELYGVKFELNYSYDDEGGYFKTIDLFPDTREDPELEDDERLEVIEQALQEIQLWDIDVVQALAETTITEGTIFRSKILVEA